jgi:hypothetical protein
LTIGFINAEGFTEIPIKFLVSRKVTLISFASRRFQSLLDIPLGAMSTTIPAYHEIIDFIAGGTTPEQVINFRPSLQSQKRVEELLQRERENKTTPEEKAKLDHFMELEHILRMAKAKAHQILASGH